MIAPLLYVVIVCNLIKVLIFFFLVKLQFEPLVTIGEAIASFLVIPDATTKGFGVVSAEDIRKSTTFGLGNGRHELKNAHIYKQQGSEDRHWSLGVGGVSSPRWILTFFGFVYFALLNILRLAPLILGLRCLCYWCFGLMFLAYSMTIAQNQSFAYQWNSGLGTVILSQTIPSTTAPAGMIFETLEIILLANLPQLSEKYPMLTTVSYSQSQVLSLAYVSYNSLLTCMLLSREWASFARHRKGLRVQQPKGSQRETYWLSLPYRYGIPLLIASAALHWLLSQTLFVVQVNFYSFDDIFDKSSSTVTLGWSSLALTMLLALGGVMLLTIVVFGFRHYPPGIPIVASNSRAISAACHPAPGKFREPILKLKYGVINDLGDGKYHVGFSSGDVRPLVPGEHYE